jgi:integrase
VAKVCGTSEEMIFRHYRTWIPGLNPEAGSKVGRILGGGGGGKLPLAASPCVSPRPKVTVEIQRDRLLKGANVEPLSGSPSAARVRRKPARRFPAEPLTLADVEALRAACSRRAPTGFRNRALLAVLYRSGLRVSEALALYPKDIDRLRWNGRESHEGTGLRDTPKNRAALEARASVITDEMRVGTFDYLRWFPEGNKTYLFRPSPLPPPRKPLTVGEYTAETWLPRKVPPLVRASLAQTYRKHLRKHILPVFSDTRLDAITVSALEAFRMNLIDKVTGKGLAVKTARDLIDGSFRALFRDARKEELVTGDPFAALDWPGKVDPEPDPFTEEERDILLDYYWRKDRHWFPFVFTQFFTGLRPGEAIGLRRGSLDLRRGRLSVRASRTLGEDNPPKTKKSKRTITVRPEVVAVLRDMPQPLHLTADDFVFTTATGRPVDEERFVQQHWHRALRATAIRPRKFYATRHTFISASLEAGYNIKRLADYCGTSVEMIERHYAGYLRDETPEEILRLGGQPSAPSNTPHHTPFPPAPSVKTGTLPGTFRRARRSSRQVANAIGELVTEGGRFELPRACALAVFKTAAFSLARPPLRCGP